MKLTTIIAANLIAGSAAFTSNTKSNLPTTTLHESKADLEVLAEKLNPIVKFYDPFGVGDNLLWNLDSEATIGWYRHAEIKHGRVAMAAFVGYCVQSNYVFPWKQNLAGDMGSTDLSPPEQWDAMTLEAKAQIILFVGFLEAYSELPINKHYTKGGIPGAYPDFDGVPHPVPFNLYDPLKFSKNKTEEEKARGLIAEINNGRLAMFAIIAFLSESKIPGSVPALSDFIKPYAGEVMSPFETTPLF